MFKKKTHFITSLLLLITIFILPIKSNANGIPFDVKPILPENQNPDVTSYISINADSNSLNQELEFILKNYQDSEQIIEVNVVNAYTSPNGVVQYVNKELENSEIIDDAYKMTNYLKLIEENKITLKPNEEKLIKATLDVDGLDGVLLGGLSFKTVQEGEVMEQENTSFQIDNEINMVIGVMINFGTDKQVEVSLGDPFVDPMPAYYAIRLPTTLNTPLFKKLDLNYQVLKDGEVLFENKGEFDFAPMTKTDLALAWEHKNIEKNKPYVLKGVFKYKDIDDTEKTLEFEKEFVFEGDNENTVLDRLTTPFVDKDFPYWLIALIVLIVLAIIYYLKKRASTYVLFSDEEVPQIIAKENEFYDKLQKKTIAVNHENAKNMHIYTKKIKNKKTKEAYYVFVKTKVLK